MQDKNTIELFEDIELLVVSIFSVIVSQIFDWGFFGVIGTATGYLLIKWYRKMEDIVETAKKEEEIRFIVQQILENKEV
jgi:hypothetical protein